MTGRRANAKTERSRAAAKRAALTAAKRAGASSRAAAKRTLRDDDAARLLAAIAEDPADDHARQVYADLLLERGDPRGTFIAMQLAPEAARDSKAEVALLEKHAKRWLGPLSGLVTPQLGVGVDYFDQATRFERGFLACCTVDSPSPRLGALAIEPIFATVEHLGMPRHAPHPLFLDSFEEFLRKASLPALRSLEVAGPMVGAVLANPIASRLAALRIMGSSPPAFAAAARAKLSALRTLWFRLEGGVVANEVTVDAIEAALARSRLERLEVEVYQAHASYRRVGSRWTVRLSEIRGEQMARRLEQLVL